MKLDLSSLNQAQTQAVLFGTTPLLVLAGAGTGKTTAITYRIAHFIHERGVAPGAVLAVTFTNKAAREMRERTARLIGYDPRDLDIGTFHSICGRLLRRYGLRVGLDPSFVIYDGDDQLMALKGVCDELKLDQQQFPARSLRFHIEQWKNQGLIPEEVRVSEFEVIQRRALEAYFLYQKRLAAANAVDFGDMLLRTLTLLRNDADVRAACQARWQHLFVDEYQDTNPVQYKLLRQLAGPMQSVTVVGDDDQSIYRWRGADIGNILGFEADFPGAQMIRLEQNYRSTQIILDAANAVIAHNRERKGKTLFTTGARGTPIALHMYLNERDEGDAIAAGAAALLRQNPQMSIAVLYRMNAQSRPIEEALVRRGLAYQVYGGTRFYDRREIKDALAYLRLLVNPKSDVDFLRVVNVPTRGIGKTTLDRLIEIGRAQGISLFEAAKNPEGLSGRARNALQNFVGLMSTYAAELKNPATLLPDLLQRFIDDSGYLMMLRQEGTEEAHARIENIGQLVAAMVEYVKLAPEPSLAGFLEEVTLATDLDGLEEGTRAVTLMTLHAAKGLEFDAVYLPGFEEDLFPHSRSKAETGGLAEERRLCYVGLTRAKHTLTLSAVHMRLFFGQIQYPTLSRFVAEIPQELLTVSGGATTASTAPKPMVKEADFNSTRAAPIRSSIPPVARPASAGVASGFAAGTRVNHATFGEGQVVSSEGAGADQKLTVQFPNIGRKVIVARFVQRV